jgi:hypothetical protein
MHVFKAQLSFSNYMIRNGNQITGTRRSTTTIIAVDKFYGFNSRLKWYKPGLEKPWGLQEVRAPRFQDNRHMKVARLSAVRTGRLYPREIFMVLMSVTGCQPQGHSVTERIMSIKNSSGTIGNRIRDLPVRSAVPQPTAPPRGWYGKFILLSGVELGRLKRYYPACWMGNGRLFHHW